MKAFVRFVQRRAEKRLRVPADYMGRLGESSFLGLIKFLMFLPLAGHRRKSDPRMIHAVRLVATGHEDCGTCVQIVVNAAHDAGVEGQIIRDVLKRNHEMLPSDVSMAVRFSDSVLANDGSDEAMRCEIESKFGATVLAELALAIASARVFPTLKRGLGLAKSCAVVKIEIDP